MNFKTTKTTDQIYAAMRTAGITSTGSGDYQDMRTNAKAHVFDAGTVREVSCETEAMEAAMRAALGE